MSLPSSLTQQLLPVDEGVRTAMKIVFGYPLLILYLRAVTRLLPRQAGQRARHFTLTWWSSLETALEVPLPTQMSAAVSDTC